jgi:gamma-glutamyl:cysteine ligase YbdK (ATP-grasp superfamily)
MNVRLLLAAVPLTLALAACGGAVAKDDGVASANGGTTTATPTASPSATLDRDQAALKFAQCMREHGIDMQDPKGGRIEIRAPRGMDPKKAEAAHEACRSIMDSVVGDKVTPDPQDYDRMVKFAQCMREHGVDMPDPKPGEGLRLQFKGGSKDQLEAAQKACEQYEPGMGKGEKKISGGKP